MSTTPASGLCVDCHKLKVMKRTAGPRSARCAPHQAEFRRYTKKASKHKARTGQDYPGKYVPEAVARAVHVTPEVIDELKAIQVVFDRTVVNLQYNRPKGISLKDDWFVQYIGVYAEMGSAAQKLAKLIRGLERSMRIVD